MNTFQIEENLKTLILSYDEDDFLYQLLGIYNFPKSTIAKLKKNPTQVSGKTNITVLKNKFVFQIVEHDASNKNKVYSDIDILTKDISLNKYTPRFLIVTDFQIFLARDTKTNETLDCNFEELYKNYAFFLPWIGMEKAVYATENPADIRASSKMAKLYDQIISDNLKYSTEHLHDLNIFLSRLLFCFFAEDTGVFEDDIFKNFIKSYTHIDGRDLSINLDILFEVLNTEEKEEYSSHFQNFPYVNGGLFRNSIHLPEFTKKSRDMIIECAELDWKEINPDIFGSMIQAVVHPDQRENLGMHYTSVPNIMKVIEPLFLNDLHAEFARSFDEIKKLQKLQERISKICVFDPACGSGNFLIIAFKELSKIEINILQRIQSINSQEFLRFGSFSSIQLSQFYGIEIDDFAHEMAILSLWLAQHQMNNKFKDIFGKSNPTLPLKEGGKIVCANATRVDWEEVCPKVDEKGNQKEIYIAGNPPYYGARKQDDEQKKDMEALFRNYNGYNNIDYITCWFLKGSEYIEGANNKCAFVSTNSICQGEQVPLIWPIILKNDVEIDFAYQSFKWKNSAKGNAGVTCIIVGLRSVNLNKKYLFIDNKKIEAKNINPYLADASNLYIAKRSKPISEINEMCF